MRTTEKCGRPWSDEHSGEHQIRALRAHHAQAMLRTSGACLDGRGVPRPLRHSAHEVPDESPHAEDDDIDDAVSQDVPNHFGHPLRQNAEQDEQFVRAEIQLTNDQAGHVARFEVLLHDVHSSQYTNLCTFRILNTTWCTHASEEIGRSGHRQPGQRPDTG